MSMISKDDVRHVAKLAELEFNEEQADKMTKQLDKILAHVANISKADTSAVLPTAHTLEINNVFREDIIKKQLSAKDALSNAPEEYKGGFLVPKID